MKRIVCSCIVLSLLAAAPLRGADKTEKKAKRDTTAAYFMLPKTITLSDEQKVKFDEVKKEFVAKAEELQTKSDAILTADQKKAQREATKAARAAGKKGNELKQAIAAAVQLSDEQKEQRLESDKEILTLKEEIREKISTFLTAEQKDLLPKKRKKQA